VSAADAPAQRPGRRSGLVGLPARPAATVAGEPTAGTDEPVADPGREPTAPDPDTEAAREASVATERAVRRAPARGASKQRDARRPQTTGGVVDLAGARTQQLTTYLPDVLIREAKRRAFELGEAGFRTSAAEIFASLVMDIPTTADEARARVRELRKRRGET